jgi:predicted nucleic acid-binding protein
VPVLWFYEASAVLSREQNRGTLAAPKAEDFIAELQALRIAANAESAARVFGDVHGLALAYRLTSYDAAYLELALRRSLPLATLDDDLIRASKARLGQPERISPSRMAEILEVDTTGQKVRC